MQARSQVEPIDRLFTDVIEGGDLDELAAIVHDDVRVSDIAFDGAYEGRDEYAGHVEMLRTAFDDLTSSYAVLGEGEGTIAVEYHVTGVHAGPFAGVEATGNEVSIDGIDVFTVEDGRIRSIRTCFDLFGLFTDIEAASFPGE